MKARLDSDDLAWDRSDELWEEAQRHVRLSSTCRRIEALAEKVFGQPATLVTPLIIGGFNVLYPMSIEGHGTQYLVRVPCPNQAVFPEEKTLVEAATAAFISKYTAIPIPQQFSHGIDPDIGPFIIMQDLGSRRGMGSALEAPRKDPNETPVLRSDIPESKLKCVYTRMARCVLRLAQPTFPRIGSLVEISLGSYDVKERPFTLNMSNLVQLSNVPRSIFPPKGTTYQTADEWYTVLADMQIATLLFQHNDVVSSEDDCKTKFVARQLFRRLAKKGRLSSFGFAEDDWSEGHQNAGARLPAPNGSASFRLWSDDFRPNNIIVDEDDNILGAIDWEYAHVAPTQFLLDPPWWLLLEVPEMWDDGIDDWTSVYDKRLPTWLSSMREAEKDASPVSLLLSDYMRESWATGRFWLSYAARKSWAFDTVYWKYLDERFFGVRDKSIAEEELWKTRVHLLSEKEQDAMELMVQTKMEESKERILIEWNDEEARKRLSLFLLD